MLRRSFELNYLRFATARSFALATLLLLESTNAPAATERDSADLPAVSGRLQPFGSYNLNYSGHTASVLRDGSVLFFGNDVPTDGRLDHDAYRTTLRDRRSQNFPNPPDPTPKLWDAARRGWRRVPLAPECDSFDRFLHTSTVLSNDRVLIAGGLCDRASLGGEKESRKPFAAMSLWDSKSRQWQSAPVLRQPRVYHSASLLPDDSVLIIGGEIDPLFAAGIDEPALTSVERYVSGRVESWPSLSFARARHTSTVLADGSVLVAGGFSRLRAIAAVEQWNSNTRIWEQLPPLRFARYGHTATRLADGRVLIAGGMDSNGDLLSSVEVWDPVRHSWQSAPELPIPLNGHAATLLASGQVLIAGGAWISSYSRPIPWAWTWTPDSDHWQVAGHTMPGTETELATGITLVPRANGSAVVLADRHIMLWKPVVESLDAIPQWQSRPSVARLADDRVMVVGRALADPGTWQPRAHIWNPVDGRWSSAGALNATAWMQEDTLQLPSGSVLHVGMNYERTFQCERWEAAGNQWRPCGSIELEYPNQWPVHLGLLSDGRAIALANMHEAFVFDEIANAWTLWRSEWKTDGQPSGAHVRAMHPLARVFDETANRWIEINDAAARFYPVSGALWDPKAKLWAYVGERGIGGHAEYLPDGCAISIVPLAVFDPQSGRSKPQPDPGLNFDPLQADMVVLTDGTVFAAGVTPGSKDAGSGFFHRKASCAGFESDSSEELPISGEIILRDPVAPSAAVSSNPATPATKPAWYEQLASIIAEYKWPIAAGSGLLVTIFVMLYARARWEIQLPSLPRLVVYGSIAAIAALLLVQKLKYQYNLSKPNCEESPAACLDPDTGILSSTATLASPKDGETAIPCRFVGVWNSIHGNTVRRIEFKDDGTYFMEPNVSMGDPPRGYRGHWARQGDNIVWRHDFGNQELDVNKILLATDKAFTLQETNGKHTDFELVRAVASKRCTK